MKKIISIISILAIFLATSTTTLAKTPDDAAYREIMQKINEEYNLDLGYVEVDSDVISLGEYEAELRSLAIQQKEVNDMIAQRRVYQGSEKYRARAVTSKTVEKAVWGGYSYQFKIKATYDVSGTTISNPRAISISRTLAAAASDLDYTPNIGSPTTDIIDSGRTLTVTYYGAYTAGGRLIAANVKLYTEFYFDS